MKILLGVHKFFPKHSAGTEVLTLELARGLRSRGHTIYIVSATQEGKNFAKSEPWLTQDEYDGFSVYRLHFGEPHAVNKVASHFGSSERIRLVKDLVDRLHVDLVHFNHIMGFSAQVITEVSGAGIPVFFTPTDYWVVCPQRTLLRRYDGMVCDGPGDAVKCLRCFIPIPEWAARWAMQMGRTPIKKWSKGISSLFELGRRVEMMVGCVNEAQCVFAETKFLADILVRHGVNPSLIKVVPTGVDIGPLPENIFIQESWSESSPFRLGFIGTLREIKGPHVVLEALSLLKENTGKIIFEIYGDLDLRNSYCRTLSERAKSLNVKVEFKGVFPHEKIGSILRGFHAILIPSLWYESAPLVLCSALSAGTPVLVSDFGGMTELFEEGVQGYAFPAGDAKALNKIISNILENPEVIRKIWRNRKMRGRTTLDYVKDIEAEYERCLNEKWTHTQ